MTPFLTIIESPFRGDVQQNLNYLHDAMRDSMLRNEVPFASHMLYTQVLDDTNPEERILGMNLGFQYYRAARLCAVYEDFGITSGMEQGIAMARANGVPIVHRTIRPIITINATENERQ